jgi:hypothetical protein
MSVLNAFKSLINVLVSPLPSASEERGMHRIARDEEASAQEAALAEACGLDPYDPNRRLDVTHLDA